MLGINQDDRIITCDFHIYLNSRGSELHSISYLMSLYGITQCHIYVLYISYFANKCQIGSLDNLDHEQLSLVTDYINTKKI